MTPALLARLVQKAAPMILTLAMMALVVGFAAMTLIA